METEVSSGETKSSPPWNISAGILATSGEKDAGKVRPERDTNYR